MKPLAILAAALFVCCAPAVGSAQAPGKAPAKPLVLAVVDGEEITTRDVEAFHRTLPPQMQQVPVEQIQSQIVDQLVNQMLIAQAARQLGLDKREEVKRQIAIAETRALNEAFLEIELEKAANEKLVRDAYSKAIALETKKEEIRARHILVKTKAEAVEIIVALKGGADFIALAKEKSTGPSGRNGGDLGFFSDGQMVPPFSKAAFALQKGQITEQPVQTQFGWHIIKLEDRRMAGARKYEEVAPQIREQLVTEAYTALLEKLKAGSKITRFDQARQGIKRVP